MYPDFHGIFFAKSNSFDLNSEILTQNDRTAANKNHLRFYPIFMVWVRLGGTKSRCASGQNLEREALLLAPHERRPRRDVGFDRLARSIE